MSEEIKNKEPELPSFIKAAPELLPVWDWWVKEGKSTLMMLVVAGIAVAGFYGVRNWLRVRDANANNALVSAFAVDELEQAAAKYGSTKAGYAIRLRLAKGYYDAERYQEALDTYDKLVDGDAAFRDIARVGRAFALEGLGKIDDAAKAFADYAGDEANKTSYLLLTAKLGVARCKALKGDKEGAAKDFEALKTAATDDAAKNRIERMADAIKRHDPKRAARSLFDAANAAAAEVESTAKPEAAKPAAPAPAAKPEAAKPAAPAPAAKPEAAKPAAKPAA